MATIKNKGIKGQLTSPACAIHSVIAPLQKIRAPKLTTQNFQFGTITLHLFPNICCSIWELKEFTQKMVDTFRKIVNSDIRYQQRKSNIPAFLGVRDVCVKFSAAAIRPEDIKFEQLVLYDCYPYLRITIDSIEVAVFIIRCWCRRLGLAPLHYSVVEEVKRNGKKELVANDYYLNKSNPYLFKELVRIKSVQAIKFGAAAEILTYQVDRKKDIWSIPTIRVSQKFGQQINVYTERNMKALAKELQEGQLQRLRVKRSRAHAAAVARLEYNKARRLATAAAITDSYYGRYRYKLSMNCHYYGEAQNARYLDDVQISTLKRNKKIIERLRPDLMPDIVGAEELYREFRALESELEIERSKRVEAEKALASAPAAPAAPAPVEEEEHYYSYKTDAFRTRKQLKEYFGSEMSMIKTDNTPEKLQPKDFTGVEVSKAVELISAFAQVEVDPVTKQLSLKF